MKLQVVLFFFAIIVSVFTVGTVFASTSDGTISGYAWSDQIGWVNFGYINGSAHITDSVLTGYAWNENKGRINLNPTNGGVENDGNGLLSGYAWGEGIGWLNFSGVAVSSSGAFSGATTAMVNGNNVTINFSCDKCNVQTDWRPVNSRGGGGGLPVGAYSAPNIPISGFNILINNGAKYTNNVDVKIKLNAGFDVKKMAVSNSADFAGVGQEDYNSIKDWRLQPGDGKKTVYVKFYTQYGQVSQVVQTDIILDALLPEVLITNAKEKYSDNEDVVITGKSKAFSEITLLIDNKNYAIFSVDNNGDWSVNLGKFAMSSHHLEFYATDLAGNKSKNVLIDFFVEKAGIVLVPAIPSIIRQLEKGIEPFIPKFFKKEQLQPVEIVTVPKLTPSAFKGINSYLSTKTLSRFVLAPLPADIKVIAEKFPQVEKTFNEVGVANISDLSKLKTANIEIPGLTQSLGLPETQITSGKFAMLKGIPLAKLTSTAKARIPSEIVFSKVGNGLVDLNIALSLNNKGQTEQSITTLAGKPLQLIVRVDKPAKKVSGYFVFKSRNSTSNQTSFVIPLNKLADSANFEKPNLASTFDLSKIALASLEGAPSLEADNVVENKNAEKRLVLSQFEYENTGEGVYTATVQTPVINGKYEIITTIDYENIDLVSKEIKMITVVDPEGYIYEKNGDKETRIGGAITSLYWLNPDTKQYELWPAKDFQQENPQTTDVRGTYSFLVPEGYYYLKVDAPGYLSYDGKPFQVTEGSGVHINIEMKNKFWWLNFLDWKTVLLIVVVLMLFYNFYRDRMRDAMAFKNKTT